MLRKTVLLWLLLLVLLDQSFAQQENGKFIRHEIHASSLENNPAGEVASRTVLTYVPPGYQTSAKRYPVVYFLHGFGAPYDDNFQKPGWPKFLDTAIAQGVIKPFILVHVDNRTHLRGSWYTNSPLNGNWEDFMTTEVVNFIDSTFRTIPHRNSRGIAGFSMGGYGSLRLAMRHPDIYSTVYAISPAFYGPRGGDKNTSIFDIIRQTKTREELVNNWNASVVIALGRTFSPNMENPPFYCDLPFKYMEDEWVRDEDVIEKWRENQLINLVNSHISNLKKLKAIKFEWGRDEAPSWRTVCNTISLTLQDYNIEHIAEEFNGGHAKAKFGKVGRYKTDMLPFFNRNLFFE